MNSSVSAGKRSMTSLLATRMTELGLGTVFNNYFLRCDSRDKEKYLSPEMVMTLEEFFNANQRITRDWSDRFVCSSSGTLGFALQSVAFKKLKSFLLKHGFDHRHWVMLADVRRDQQLNLFPFSALTHGHLMTLPLTYVKGIKKSSRTFQWFAQLFPVRSQTITISDVLQVTEADIATITGVFHAWKMPYSDVQALRVFVKKVQGKLRRLGIPDDAGPFLTITFEREHRKTVRLAS
jgi:hypothetical protein